MITILQQRALKYSFREYLRIKKSLGLEQDLDALYFGYGANLSIERFKKWHIPVEIIGTAFLENHQLKFNLPCEYVGKGFAGIEETKGMKVWGILFKVNSNALRMLDVLEWVPFKFYNRKTFSVISNGKTYTKVHSYVTCYPRHDLLPSKGYLDFIIQSGVNANFPEEYLKELASTQAKTNFEIDNTFVLRDPARKRLFINRLSRIYQIHDNLREKLTRLIP